MRRKKTLPLESCVGRDRAHLIHGALRAAAAPDPNELKPDAPADQPAPAPAQVNEIQPGNGTSPAAQNASSNADGQQLADDKDLASSKHKKKKGLLHKVIPGN